MAQQYGVHNDNARYLQLLRSSRVQPFTSECFPADYTKVQLKDNDCLFGVTANLECLPNLAVWSGHPIIPFGMMDTDKFFALVMPYLSNMTDVEQALITPQIHYLAAFGTVHSVNTYDYTVEICVTVGTTTRILLLTVMNMMEPESGLDTCKVRDTLN